MRGKALFDKIGKMCYTARMNLPAYVRGAIFDLDGTLLNSLDAWKNVDVRFFAERGIVLPDDYPHAIEALDLIDAAVYTKARFSLPEPPESIVEEWRRLMREEYACNVLPKPYVCDFLRALAARGVKLAIATSSAPELFLPALRRAGVDALFSAFVTTREAGKSKAFPDVYLEAAKRLALPAAECAVFEDIPLGAQSAKTGGFFTVGVFDPHDAADRPRMRAICDLYITSYQELL